MKSYMVQMVEWLAKQDYRGNNPLDRANMEARRLLAEEQEQKPTAPASHPSTAKSADRCGELVDRLRAHIKYQKESEADYLVYGEIEDILSEFSKDADGKETTK